MARWLLGGKFVGGETPWWRGNLIPLLIIYQERGGIFQNNYSNVYHKQNKMTSCYTVAMTTLVAGPDLIKTEIPRFLIFALTKDHLHQPI